MTRWTPALRIGLFGLAAIVVLGVVAPFVWGGQADELTGVVRAHPSSEHWLGTDALGRDVFARTMTATRLTLLLTLAATAIAAAFGIALGTAVWVAGPRVRSVGLRIIDILISYPALILALMVATVLRAGELAAVLAIGVGAAPAFARLTANLAASVAGRDFVATARLMGVPPPRLLTRHLLPNIGAPLLVLLSVAFAQILSVLSGLSFLGLGVQPPSYDWGALLNSGLLDVYTNPAEAIGPALAITITGVLAGFTGDGLAAGLHTRTRRKSAVRTAIDSVLPAAPRPDALLDVQDLRLTLPDGTTLVDGVSFEVRPGEIVGLVGESGSGKSLIAMSAAQLVPEPLHLRAGRLTLGELDLQAPPRDRAQRAKLATQLGVVFQDPSASYNPALRIGGQLTETVRLHQGLSRAEARRRAIEALDRVHVRDPERVIRQYPHELSGGMRQRAMIAAAVLPGPRLLIADEPTTALDVTVQAGVLDLLRELNREQDLSMLFISHDIGVVGSLCNRVLVVYSGRIVEELSAADLRTGRARHPYTQALLAARPRLDGEPTRLATIPGRPPQPADRPAGCAFAPRCALAVDVCHTRRPEPIAGVACHVVNADQGNGSRVGAPTTTGEL